MQVPEEPRIRRSQRDYSLPFKLAVVGEVAQLLVDQAVHVYNEERPHLSLNYLTPNQVHQQGKSPAGKSAQGPCLITVNT